MFAQIMTYAIFSKFCVKLKKCFNNELIVFTDFDQIRYPRVFEVADYESKVKFLKFGMTYPIWRHQINFLSISLIPCTQKFLGSLIIII